jgi:hypothetical protein
MAKWGGGGEGNGEAEKTGRHDLFVLSSCTLSFFSLLIFLVPLIIFKIIVKIYKIIGCI